MSRELKRSVAAFEAYFGTTKTDPCRAHFRRALAFFADNNPKLVPAMCAATGVSPATVENAQKGNRTGLQDAQREAVARFACTEAAKKGIEIPASLAQKIGYQPATV